MHTPYQAILLLGAVFLLSPLGWCDMQRGLVARHLK
jgi:hypothetical protein